MAATKSTVMIGSALLIAAAAATLYTSSSSSPSEITEIDESVEDYITADDVCKIFDRLYLEMQAVLAQLSRTVQQIQMSGQTIPEKQLRMMLKAEFERALGIKQKQVLEEFDMDDDCLEEATWEFLENEAEHPKVKVAVERFQKLWENVTGESVVGKRPGKPGKGAEKLELLSPNRTIEAAEKYFDTLTNAMAELVQQFKKDGKDLKNTSVAQDLHMQFAAVASDKGEGALKEMGITLAQFQKSIESNASNVKVARSLGMMQMKQQQTMMSMGVPAS